MTGAGLCLYMEEQGNFHAITAGEAYRSGQLDADELDYYIRKYSIRSILNVAGEIVDGPHYRDEISACRQYGLSHYDVKLPSSSQPSLEKMKALIEVFRNAPRPILIHCRSGADRTGLVAAMWKVVVDGESKEEAARCLSMWYGHFPLGRTRSMDDSFRRWEPSAMSPGFQRSVKKGTSLTY